MACHHTSANYLSLRASTPSLQILPCYGRLSRTLRLLLLLACALACGLLPFRTTLLPSVPCNKPWKRKNEDHVKIEKEDEEEEGEGGERMRMRMKNDVEKDSDRGEGCIQKSECGIQKGVHFMKIYDCEDK